MSKKTCDGTLQIAARCQHQTLISKLSLMMTVKQLTKVDLFADVYIKKLGLNCRTNPCAELTSPTLPR